MMECHHSVLVSRSTFRIDFWWCWCAHTSQHCCFLWCFKPLVSTHARCDILAYAHTYWLKQQDVITFTYHHTETIDVSMHSRKFEGRQSFNWFQALKVMKRNQVRSSFWFLRVSVFEYCWMTAGLLLKCSDHIRSNGREEAAPTPRHRPWCWRMRSGRPELCWPIFPGGPPWRGEGTARSTECGHSN